MTGQGVVKAWYSQYYHQQHLKHNNISFPKSDPLLSLPMQKGKAKSILRPFHRNGIAQQMGRFDFTSQLRFSQHMQKVGRKSAISKLLRK